jgi:hypothetical protein
VKEIKRKVLVIILALVVAMLAAQIIVVMPVQATPKEKLDFELYIEGVAMGYGPWGTYHAGPRGTEDDNPEPKDLIQRTFHAKQVNFVLFYAELTIGDETLICSPLDEQFNFVFDEKHSFNFCWNTVTGTSKAKDTLTFYEDDGTTIRGTLEITVRDKIMYVPDEEGNPTLVSEGNIFGKGTGALKGAKIEGTTSGEDVGMWPAVDENGDPINDDQGNQIVLPIRGLTRSGKISGWVTIP